MRRTWMSRRFHTGTQRQPRLFFASNGYVHIAGEKRPVSNCRWPCMLPLETITIAKFSDGMLHAVYAMPVESKP